ncbi:MAG: lipopolysaccharide heptosyltransferase II [Verrucomicrobiota bacterium]|nr:lipopolysaccharide heptosyltransferase II [Verrucomicrobiota bacterium]
MQLHNLKPRNVLVRMPNWIGDLVMATPVLLDLRAAFPQATLTAMAPSPLSELLEEDPSIDELFSFTRSRNPFSRRENRDIVAKLSQGDFDASILLTNSFSSAWLFWQGKIPCRIGFRGDGRNFLLTHPVDRPKEKWHQVDLYKKLLEPLGISRSSTAPRLFLLESELQQVRELLRQRGVQRGDLLVGMHAGASFGPAKRWPAENFRLLAKALAEKGVWILFFGDAVESSFVKEICSEMPQNVINLAGLTSLRELSCLIHECHLLITNDSGPMHIGAAVGTELIALFGSTDEKVTGPYLRPDAVLRKAVPCAPCLRRVCPIHFPCMKEIGVEEVKERALQKLSKSRPR